MYFLKVSKHQLKKKKTQMIEIRYFIQENIINKGKQFSNEKVTFPTPSVIIKQSRVALIQDFSLRGLPLCLLRNTEIRRFSSVL